MKISFYYVKAEYIQYLKETEIKVRGFTTVPNVEYANHKTVFSVEVVKDFDVANNIVLYVIAIISSLVAIVIITILIVINKKRTKKRRFITNVLNNKDDTTFLTK